MCRSCGAIVGADQNQCAVCDASVTTASQPARSRLAADRETIRFARAVLTRPYKFTIIFLITNFFIFLLMWESSGMTWAALWSQFPYPVLIAYGAKVNSLINEQHQWWRFVTPMFIHVNLPHVLINMYSLWMVGPYVEKLYGSAKFVVFWVLTGIAGVVASYLTVVNSDASLGSLGRFLFKTQDVPSAGASGALFGLVGVLFVFGIKFRRELPEGFKRAFGTGMLPIILINLFIGYLGRGVIDNAAHLGGLLSGAALAVVVQYRRPGERTSITTSWYVIQIAALLLVVVSFFKVAQHFKDPIASTPTQITQDSSPTNHAFISYSMAMNEAQEKLNEAMNGQTAAVDEAIKALDSTPTLDQKADELRQQLKLLLFKAKSGTASPSPSPKSNKLGPESKTLEEEINLWKKDYNQWLKTTGRNY
jgi:membrane associated rhomboid family serine protease